MPHLISFLYEWEWSVRRNDEYSLTTCREADLWRHESGRKLGFGNPSLLKELGFTINYRWQSKSSLATGTVPAYSTVDA